MIGTLSEPQGAVEGAVSRSDFKIRGVERAAVDILTKTYDTLKSIIVPDFCFYCRQYIYSDVNRLVDFESNSFLCITCIMHIKPIISEVLKLNADYALHVYAVSAYEDPLRQLILAKEWSDYTASKQLARLIWDLSFLQSASYDYLVPVPAHWSRTAYRGYNQAVVMATELSRLSGIPVLEALQRVKRTRLQRSCTAVERKKNVSEAFALTSEQGLLEDKKILLIDDLMTTGSTLFACGRELIRERPEEIAALVACRVV